MGVLPVPGNGQSFAEAHHQASLSAEFSPVWGKPSPFYELAGDISGDWGQTFIQKYLRVNDMFPLVHLSFIDAGISLKAPPGMTEATLSNPVWRQSYKHAALNAVTTARPLYLSIGNEVNRWYEKHGIGEDNPDGFQHYVSLYHETYDAVKKLSPGTKVFCTFSREIVSENREANLEVLSMFQPPKMDILVLTSYPYAISGINRVSDIPDDYYSRALSYMPGKPFGFSELAWSSLDAFGGEQGQADFITLAATRLTVAQGVDLHLFGWPWLHDLDDNDSIGLIKRDGTERLAYQAWQELSFSSR